MIEINLAQYQENTATYYITVDGDIIEDKVEAKYFGIEGCVTIDGFYPGSLEDMKKSALRQYKDAKIERKKQTMYKLGQIAQLVYGDEVPTNILNQLLINPLSGLGLMSKQGALKSADQEQLADLMSSIDMGIMDGLKNVPSTIQGSFWLGYYHFVKAMELGKKYTIDDLKTIGQALYGERWQTDLSNALGLSDARRIRQWLAGERSIPFGIWQDLAAILKTKQMQMSEILNSITIDNGLAKSLKLTDC